MSFVGSSRGCACFQLVRAVRTSSRSCSAACRLFFESDVVAVAEPPHRTGAHPDAPRPQAAANFFQRQVGFGSDQLQQPLPVRIQRRALAAHRLSRHRSALPPARNPPDRRTRAYLERRRSFMAGRSRLHRTHNPFTQITRIGLRHHCPPNHRSEETRPSARLCESPSFRFRFNPIGLCSSSSTSPIPPGSVNPRRRSDFTAAIGG